MPPCCCSSRIIHGYLIVGPSSASCHLRPTARCSTARSDRARDENTKQMHTGSAGSEIPGANCRAHWSQARSRWQLPAHCRAEELPIGIKVRSCYLIPRPIDVLLCCDGQRDTERRNGCVCLTRIEEQSKIVREVERTAGVYVQGEWQKVQKYTQGFLRARSLISCIGFVSTSEKPYSMC